MKVMKAKRHLCVSLYKKRSDACKLHSSAFTPDFPTRLRTSIETNNYAGGHRTSTIFTQSNDEIVATTQTSSYVAS